MSTSAEDIRNSREQLVADLKAAFEDAEALLKATAIGGSEELTELRAKAEKSLDHAKARLADAQADLLTRTRDAARRADAYVHDNPWNAVLVAAGVGMMIGMLGSRQ